MITELENTDIEKNSLYIELKITSFCNMKCEYCFSHESIKSELNIYKVLDFIKLYYPSKSTYVFYIYGGEPFNEKNLKTIIELILNFSNNSSIIIQSNGTINISDSNILINDKVKFCLSYHIDHIIKKQSDIFIKNIIYLKKFNAIDEVAILSKNKINENNIIFKKLTILNVEFYIKPLYQQSFDWDNSMNQHKIIKIKYNDNTTELFSCSQLQSLNITNFYNWTCSSGISCILINYDGKIYNCEFDLINNREPIFDLNVDNINFKPCKKLCENNFCIQYHSDKILKG